MDDLTGLTPDIPDDLEPHTPTLGRECFASAYIRRFVFRTHYKCARAGVSQNVIPSKRHFGGAVPFAFTENGVAMLSSVLNSKQAIEINIAIMRTFTMLRKALLLQKDIMQEMGSIKKQLVEHDNKILVIFEYLKQVEESNQQQIEQDKRKQIGYKRQGEE